MVNPEGPEALERSQRHEDRMFAICLLGQLHGRVALPELLVLAESGTRREQVAAFRGIAADGLDFVTRSDGSGTYERELALWAASGYVAVNVVVGPALPAMPIAALGLLAVALTVLGLRRVGASALAPD